MIKMCDSCTNNKNYGKLFCNSCGKVQEIKLGSNLSIFDVFGLENSVGVDKGVLDKKYSELIILMHPDRFAHATESEKLIAEANTATINKAYTILSSEVEIYNYILSHVKDINAEKILEDEDQFLVEKMHLHDELSSITSSEKCANFRHKLNGLYSTRLVDVRKNIGKNSWNNAKNSLEKLKFIQNLIKIAEKKQYMLEIEEKTLKK